MEDEPTRMLDKKPEDLTTGEALKINAIIGAATLAIPVVIIGGFVGIGVAVDKFKARRANRKNKKSES
jgi:hypothetical protein